MLQVGMWRTTLSYHTHATHGTAVILPLHPYKPGPVPSKDLHIPVNVAARLSQGVHSWNTWLNIIQCARY